MIVLGCSNRLRCTTEERAQKWERATTDWELRREDDVLDLGVEVIIPDFAVEHPDRRWAILEGTVLSPGG